MPRITTMTALATLAASLSATPVFAQTSTTAATTTVTVYGLIDAVVRRASNANAAKDSLTSMEDGLITGSRLGFRGTEDLGGGLRAILNMESGFEVGTGASLQGTTAADYGQEAVSPRFWGREIYLGLGGTWGTVTAGHQYTTAHQIAIRFQPLGNPNFAALSLFSSHHIPRQDNLLRVETKVGDFDLQASRTFGEQATSSSANSSWAIGGGYRKGDLALGGYVQQMDNRAGSETRKIVGVGGNYRINSTFALFAAYMQRSAAVSPQENKVWALGANVELSPAITLSLQVFDDRQTGSAALKGSRKLAWVHGSYRFSRRSDVYAVIDQNKVEGGYARPAFMGTLGTQTALSLGLRHRF